MNRINPPGGLRSVLNVLKGRAVCLYVVKCEMKQLRKVRRGKKEKDFSRGAF